MAHVSQTGLSLIKRFESLRLAAYDDGKGTWTIGWGHTGPEAARGITWTQEFADRIFASDLRRFEISVENSLTHAATQGQFDAMVSLAFNIGEDAFKKSTVLRRFNQGDRPGAAEAFIMWDDEGMPTHEGLELRRAAEIYRFAS